MRAKTILHPANVFLFPALATLIVWAGTPDEWFWEVRVSNRATWSDLLPGIIIAFVSFAAGVALVACLGSGKSHLGRAPRRPRVKEIQWVLLVITLLSTAILGFFAIRSSGFSGLFDSNSLRSNYRSGVTTFFLLTTASVILPFAQRILSGHWRDVAMTPLLISVVLAVYRAVVGLERIAIYIPLMSIIVAYVAVRVPRLKKRHLLWAVVSSVVFVAIFVVAESVRSYAQKTRENEVALDNVVVYGLKRLNMYFATSVNTAGAEYLLYKEGSRAMPVFMQTCYPVASLLYNKLELRPFNWSAATLGEESSLSAMGMYNEEFNNRWGVVSPLAEGPPSAIVFWAVWGGVGFWLHRRTFSTKCNAVTLSLFAMFLTALLDNQTRVAMLGAPHFLIPFALLAFTSKFVDVLYAQDNAG